MSKGSTPRRVDHEKYSNNFDHIFGKSKDFKVKQQDLTELNGDGNRTRGRYGQDESSNRPNND